MSMLETFLSTAAGFFLSLFVQWLVLPVLLGVNIPIEMNLAFAAIMTVVSLLRQFVMRRVFEALHIRRPLSGFVQAVIAECYRQRDVEGWTVEHDDAHDVGDLALAGAAYAKQAYIHLDGIGFGNNPRMLLPNFWPWSHDWWKPTGFRRDLVKACALIIAEGDKFDRSRKTKRRSF
jgi:hypothetical protein